MFFQQLVNGLSIGSIYALMAVGYSLIYSLLNFTNFAHSITVTIGCWCPWRRGTRLPGLLPGQSQTDPASSMHPHPDLRKHSNPKAARSSLPRPIRQVMWTSGPSFPRLKKSNMGNLVFPAHLIKSNGAGGRIRPDKGDYPVIL